MKLSWQTASVLCAWAWAWVSQYACESIYVDWFAWGHQRISRQVFQLNFSATATICTPPAFRLHSNDNRSERHLRWRGVCSAANCRSLCALMSRICIRHLLWTAPRWPIPSETQTKALKMASNNLIDGYWGAVSRQWGHISWGLDLMTYNWELVSSDAVKRVLAFDPEANSSWGQKTLLPNWIPTQRGCRWVIRGVPEIFRAFKVLFEEI